MSFTNCELIKLLKYIETTPVIYDVAHPKHYDVSQRELAWKEIGAKMKKKASACKSRWVHLRDALRRKLRKRLLSPEKGDKPYRYEEQMAFIIPFFQKMEVSYVVEGDFDAELETMATDISQDRDFDDMVKFTYYDDMKLISSVKEVIYDTKNYESMNHNLSNRVWVEISKILQKPANQCKLRWNNMKDTLRRKLKAREKMKNKRKMSAFKYKYENEMAFVIPHFTYRPNRGSLDETDTELENDADNISMHEFDDDEDERDVKFEFTPVDELSNLEVEDTRKRSFTDVLSNDVEVPKKKSKLIQDYDDVDTFLLSIGSTMKKLKPFYKNKVKSKIFELVQEYELKQIVETDDA